MLPPVSYVGAFPIEVFRGDTMNYYRLSCDYDSPLYKITVRATINFNISSEVFRFNYIGMELTRKKMIFPKPLDLHLDSLDLNKEKKPKIIADPSPYDRFAVNYSVDKAKFYYPNTQKMILRGYQILNKTKGPFNSTFYTIKAKFFNLFRLVQYQIGVAIFSNYTGQLYWIKDGFPTPKYKDFQDLNLTSEEAKKYIANAQEFLRKGKLFENPPAVLVKTEFAKVFRSNVSHWPSYYRLAYLYQGFVQASPVSFQVSVLLKVNITNLSVRLSYLGMRRAPTRKIPNRTDIIQIESSEEKQVTTLSPYEQFALDYSIRLVHHFFPLTNWLYLRSTKIKNISSEFAGNLYTCLLSFLSGRVKIYSFYTKVLIRPNFTAQAYYLWDGYEGISKDKFAEISMESEEGRKVIAFTLYNIEKHGFFSDPAVYLEPIRIMHYQKVGIQVQDLFWISLKYSLMESDCIINAYVFSSTESREILHFGRIEMIRGNLLSST